MIEDLCAGSKILWGLEEKGFGIQLGRSSACPEARVLACIERSGSISTTISDKCKAHLPRLLVEGKETVAPGGAQVGARAHPVFLFHGKEFLCHAYAAY